MIIIDIKTMDDFCGFLANNRASNHVFYEVKQNSNDASTKRVIYFNFLGTLGSLTILFQYSSTLPAKIESKDFVEDFSQALNVEDVAFIEGRVREIFLSIS